MKAVLLFLLFGIFASTSLSAPSQRNEAAVLKAIAQDVSDIEDVLTKADKEGSELSSKSKVILEAIRALTQSRPGSSSDQSNWIPDSSDIRLLDDGKGQEQTVDGRPNPLFDGRFPGGGGGVRRPPVWNPSLPSLVLSDVSSRRLEGGADRNHGDDEVLADDVVAAIQEKMAEAQFLRKVAKWFLRKIRG